MKNRVFKTVCAFALTALAFSGGAGLSALFANADVAANGGNVQTVENRLIAPKTYEEYLPLTAPTGAAVCEDYTAVAEGNVIYYYDRDEQIYQTYSHFVGGEPQEIRNLQFCENGNLYFAAAASGNNFYELNLKTLTKTKLDDIACETFVIHGKNLYFASAAGMLYTTSLDDPTAPKTPLLPTPEEGEEAHNPYKPVLAFWNGELYFTDDGIKQILYKIKPEVGIPTSVAELDIRVKYMTINAGIFACTTSAGDFYAFALPTLSSEGQITRIENGGYTSLSSFGEYVYATQTQKGVIRQYSTATKQFTDFEICSSSASNNRLSGATNAYLAGDKLWITDNGNSRVSVYNTVENTFEQPFNATLSPSFFTSNGQTALLADGAEAAIYSVSGDNYGALLQTFDDFEGELKGVANVYGKYYLLTAGYAYSLVQNAESGAFELAETKKACTSFVSPSLLTADVYGNLYVATGNFVYRFTESDFMQADTEGTQLYGNIPADAEEIAIDYERNLYALAGGKVYKNDSATPCADFTKNPLVYGGEGYSPNVRSLTFGVEENAAYLLIDGNYIVQTDALKLPTVKSIAVGDADEEIFSENSAEISVVKTAKNALLVAFNIDDLHGATYFPYLCYERQETELTALKLGQAGEYAILAVFDKPSHAYSTYIVKEEFIQILPADTYQTTYEESERKTGYLTNALPLYKFPYLTELLIAQENLPRGGEIVILGELTELDHAYYQVAYQTESGALKTGYIPKSYVALFDGTPPKSELYVQGETESDSDSLWRLGYLLLGFAAVCILTDYLILRKKKND